MHETMVDCDRRQFVAALTAAGVAGTLGPAVAQAAAASGPRRIRLGFDNFSIRALGWKAPALIDYAASLAVDTLLLSDLGVYESLDDAALAGVANLARERGVVLQIGTGSICPTSKSYNAKRWGAAVDHARLLIRVARAVGAKVARCYLGSRRDRQGEGGIYRHIEEVVKVCKSVRDDALSAGVKLAIENHAGDLQAWELVELIEAAGADFVGATMDAGNATWTMENPLDNLKALGPYAVTTGMRDSAVWETDKGAGVMWTNMGEGVVDWAAYLELYRELCPDCPFVLETCCYSWQHEAKYLEEAWWDAFPRARARDFARFLALAKNGKPYTLPAGRPTGRKSRELQQQQQKWDLEQSLRYCRAVLGLGAR